MFWYPFQIWNMIKRIIFFVITERHQSLRSRKRCIVCVEISYRLILFVFVFCNDDFVIMLVSLIEYRIKYIYIHTKNWKSNYLDMINLTNFLSKLIFLPICSNIWFSVIRINRFISIFFVFNIGNLTLSDVALLHESFRLLTRIQIDI